MIVSILQLMALPFGKSVAGRGSENPNSERREPDNQGITRIHEGDASPEQGRSAVAWGYHAGAVAARRQEVKSQPKAVKPAVKAKPVAKPVKAVAKAAKPAAKKIAAKPAAKAPAKKTMVKTAVKTPAKKASAKPASAKAAKPVAKKAEVAPKAKPAVKPAAQAAAKPKAVPAKTVKVNGPTGVVLPRAMPPRPDAATLGAEPARATKP